MADTTSRIDVKVENCSPSHALPRTHRDEEVVISGIAGRFPESDNVEQFREHLFNKTDLVSDDTRRWNIHHPEISTVGGKINNIEKFDASFFGIHFKEAHTMDPMCRMLLEHAYEAIIDAGINPGRLRGTRTGVFIGVGFSESQRTWLYEDLQTNGHGITGCTYSALAHQISYWLGVTGPSYVIDSACSSSLNAVQHAFNAIANGYCDSALVGGSHLCLHPATHIQFLRLGIISIDSRSKSFDASANGFARSEAIAMIYLQRAKDAKRIYAQVVHVKTNCDGFKEEGITFPSKVMQHALLREFYEECGVPPTSVAFVEAHGTGTRVGDPEELIAIENSFCPGRESPLLIGSVKSNVGHTETVSGLLSIAKVLIAMETGYIPPNLHYHVPREGVESLKDGRIKVITESTAWEGGYVGINSFGFGGTNVHVLLKSNTKEKNNRGLPIDGLPRLVAVSGRTEEAVETLLKNVESRPIDVEFVSLLHDIHAEDIPGHDYRGYTILPPRGTSKSPKRSLQRYHGTKRSLCFVFSGAESQWAKIGKSLLRFAAFDCAIRRCSTALKPYGVDIYNMLTKRDSNTTHNIVNSIICTTAIQIGLVDLLTGIGIVPDSFLGHEFGQLACAYTDECITAEQTILVAYVGALASMDAGRIDTTEGVRLALDPKLLDELKKIIPNPKTRSEKWLSSSIPRKQRTTIVEKSASVEYLMNSLLGATFFEGTTRILPENPITIQITPSSSPAMSLKKNLIESATNIALTDRDHENNDVFLLEALGRLYEVGLNPELKNLYPRIEYPVSRGTPMISPLVRWNHADDWYVAYYGMNEPKLRGCRNVEVDLSLDHFKYMIDHVIDGQNIIPVAGYLVLTWETLGRMYGQMFNETSVVFEDVEFHGSVPISVSSKVSLGIMIQKASGKFEIVQDDKIVVTGIVRATPQPEEEKIRVFEKSESDDSNDLSAKDIYQELRLRGYHYGTLFRGIQASNLARTRGHITWENNWATFIENMISMQIVGTNTRELLIATGIQKLVIDVEKQVRSIRQQRNNETGFSVHVDNIVDVVTSGGIQIKGLKTTAIERKETTEIPVLGRFEFVADRDQAVASLETIIWLATHIVVENQLSITIKTIEILRESGNVSPKDLVSTMILKVFDMSPVISGAMSIVVPNKNSLVNHLPATMTVTELNEISRETNAMLVVVDGLFTNHDPDLMQRLRIATKHRGFWLIREPLNSHHQVRSMVRQENFDVILEKQTEKELIMLVRKREEPTTISSIIQISNNDFTWIPKLQRTLESVYEREDFSNHRILLVSDVDFENGILGVLSCLRKEPGGEIIRGLFIQDTKAPSFSLENPLYRRQLELDLVQNVLRSGEIWGSYKFFPLDKSKPSSTCHTLVSQNTPGDLNSLEWIQESLQADPNNKNMIQVHYASIDFRHAMLAMSGSKENHPKTKKFIQRETFGREYSGINIFDGRRVMGIHPRKTLTDRCNSDGHLTWCTPDDWTLEEASTIPIAYTIGFEALYLKGKMKKGDKILIHRGASGIGQAAITLALHEGCEVFTTVGTWDKREFVKKRYPSINEHHIGNSRDSSFEQLIFESTEGRGVDIVLNCLTDEKLQASARCVARGGKFIEINESNLITSNRIGMEYLSKGISFHSITTDNLSNAPSDHKEELHRLVEEGIRRGVVKPLARTVFRRDEVQAAFEYIVAGKYIGKIVIKVCDNDNATDNYHDGLPSFYCLENSCYLIHGGLGGFGLELADWLANRGARKLALTSRKGITNGYQRIRINVWMNRGIEVKIISGKNALTREGCAAILEEAASMGPIDAIFNLAVVLRDALFTNMSIERFQECQQVKALSTQFFDKLSRALCPNLRKFVVFSSVICSRGSAGVSNYGMANSIIERVCEKRHMDNLPALAVEWGAVADVGIIADMKKDDETITIEGTSQQALHSCFSLLHIFLNQHEPIVSSNVLAEKRSTTAGSMSLMDFILRIMDLKNVKTISHHTSLVELGMDSIMTTEITNALARNFDIFLTPPELRELNLAKIVELSDTQVKRVNTSSANDVSRAKDYTYLRLLVKTVSIGDTRTQIRKPSGTRSEEDRSEIFILPGVEGSATRFQNLANELNLSATCLHYEVTGVESPSIYEIADYLLSYVKNRNKKQKHFTLVGYSFGSIVAIELARRLEFEGIICCLILINGAPEYLKSIAKKLSPANNDAQLQENILGGIMNMLSPSVCEELLVELPKHDTWDEKLRVFMQRLPTSEIENSSLEFDCTLCTSIYERIKATLDYDASKSLPIQSPMVLLQGKVRTMSLSMPEEFGIRALTKGQVDIHFVEDDLLTNLDSELLTSIIEKSFKKL